MKIIEKITIDELKKIAEKMFGNLVKAVVDIDKEIVVIDADLHSDEEQYLLSQGSKQENLWGINIYPEKDIQNRIEFDSMINLRPSLKNFTRGIDSKIIQNKIIKVVNSRIIEK